MDFRRVETGLAYFTLFGLVFYVPLETWFSLPYGLWNPFYLVDFVAMVLLLWGAVRSLRARPERSPALLCAAWAWAACNGWRATWWRVFDLMEGGSTRLDHGLVELYTVAGASVVALLCFVLTLVLITRVEKRGQV